MSPLFRKALLKADDVRMDLGLDMYEPVNIFDACVRLGLTVRFLDLKSMEGMYVKQPGDKHPTILVTNQRPLPRRCFTCAHELGHYCFNHGSRLDILVDHEDHGFYNNDELMVDAFAGAMLMPVGGILAELAKRDWKPQSASPAEFYLLCSYFGTGYQTMVTHCRVNKIITDQKAKELLKHTPAKILQSIIGSVDDKSHFKIFDCQSEVTVIDIEVSNYIILPLDVKIEGSHLKSFYRNGTWNTYIAQKPGITRVATANNSFSAFVRIQRAGYIGLAENRHLECETE